MSELKIFLNCPFEDKDEAKSLGARWDSDEKKWYITDEMDGQPFVQWLETSDPAPKKAAAEEPSPEGEKTYLNCPFEDKDECKALGGQWDGDAKKWYIPSGLDTKPFEKWIIDTSKPFGKWPG